MIEPACTGWPAKTFTPSRLAAESRPFLDEPRPFLCAIGGLLRFLRRGGARAAGLADALDRDTRQLGAVSAHALLAPLRLVGEDAQLLAAHVLHHLGADEVGELRAVRDRIAVAGRHEHLGAEPLALAVGLAVHEQGLPLLDPVLLAAHLDH